MEFSADLLSGFASAVFLRAPLLIQAIQPSFALQFLIFFCSFLTFFKNFEKIAKYDEP